MAEQKTQAALYHQSARVDSCRRTRPLEPRETSMRRKQAAGFPELPSLRRRPVPTATGGSQIARPGKGPPTHLAGAGPPEKKSVPFSLPPAPRPQGERGCPGPPEKKSVPFSP